MKKIFLLLGIFIVFSSCSTFTYKKTKINIDNSYLNNEIEIKDENKGSVYGLYCKIDGKVNDVIEMELTNNDGHVLGKIIPKNGRIRFIYDADWYSNELKIKIFSNNTPSGYINIVYKFKKIYSYKY
jgi:hypothetical protein